MKLHCNNFPTQMQIRNTISQGYYVVKSHRKVSIYCHLLERMEMNNLIFKIKTAIAQTIDIEKAKVLKLEYKSS